ncbi:MAG: hypothetical protein JXL80_07835 [Planctomycetes bacterium]|nr:hypothetical protein [Planctomycetota bacterium]
MAIEIDADYLGGNIVAERVEGSRLSVRPDLRDTGEWWFWWNFRVRGAAGQRLKVRFTDDLGPVGPNGPAMSTDGCTWTWADCEHDKHHFVCDVPPGTDEVYFAFSFPYLLRDWEQFAGTIADHPAVRLSTLTKTLKGRRVPLMVIGDPESARRNVLFTCRHHACESVAGYVLEGAIEHLLSDDAAALRRETAFSIVPIVDLDGVEEGDQGKSRRPHDHNRDYVDAPIYPSVQAIQSLMRRLAARRLVLFVDYHCPWIRNEGNESFFLVEPPEPWASRLHEFAAVLRRTDTGEIPYTGKFDVPFGTSWNTGQFGAITSGAYVRSVAGSDLRTAFTIECSYSTTEGRPATPERARRFGRGFGRAMAEYLES